MKYCRPVFRLLYKQTPELARKTFLAHQNFYVSVSCTFNSPLLGPATSLDGTKSMTDASTLLLVR